MEQVFQEFEEWWHDLIADDVVLQTKKSIAANAYEAGWKAAQQSVQLTAFGVGFVSGLLFFGLVLAMVLFIMGGD